MRRAISRRVLMVAATAALTRPGFEALAQNRPPRKIGWLKIQDRDNTPGQLRAFLNGLAALGHREGHSFVMEYRFADGDARQLGPLAQELVQANVDVILATSQPATDASRRATKSIRIVGRMTDDPVRTALRNRCHSQAATSPASILCSRK